MSEKLIYDIKIKGESIIIYLTDVSNKMLEYIQDRHDCFIYKCEDFDDIFKYQIHMRYEYDALVIYLRNNNYIYYNSYCQLK